MRQWDLAHMGRLIAGDATLVTAWRTAKRELQAYVDEVLHGNHRDQLLAARQAYLPSLWDISQRLFLETDPSTLESTPQRKAYAACADLFLLCDEQGVVVVEQATVSDPARPDFGKVCVEFPLDPSREPLPVRLNLGQDPLFVGALQKNAPVTAYWRYGDGLLYHAVAVPSPIGVFILGDRVDQQLVNDASQLVGGAYTLAWSGDRVLASIPAKGPEIDQEVSQSWVSHTRHPEVRDIVLAGRPYVAACYPLSSKVALLDAIPAAAEPAGWMLFLKTTDELEAVARQQAGVAAGLILVAALLGLAVASPLANRIARPLVALSQAMAQVGEGDLEAKATPSGPMEIVEAAHAFNRMVDGLRQKETLEKFVEKLEQLRKTADPQDPLVRDQTQFGNYVLTARLGVGGMATVYTALPAATLDEFGKVAIKVIQRAYAQDNEYKARFRREFQIMQRLQHPGLVRVLESGDLNGLLYIAMEYVEGENLRELLEREGSLELARFLELAIPLLEAVEAAHQAGVTHRDLKPENLMITQGGIKVMDFGLASASGASRVTQSGDTVGTPLYMAPEQVRGGTCQASSDQYSLGVIFFEMLTGVPPFQADHPMALILKHITDPPPKPRDICSDIPAAVEVAILKMLCKEPPQRYANLLEVKTALLSS
ncbi:protein kinase [bacterium]|nr:protein kinase [bacterium]